MSKVIKLGNYKGIEFKVEIKRTGELNSLSPYLSNILSYPKSKFERADKLGFGFGFFELSRILFISS